MQISADYCKPLIETTTTTLSYLLITLSDPEGHFIHCVFGK